LSNRIWIGLLFIVFGVGFLLHQADMWDFTSILSTWWPLILIVIGVILLINRNYSSAISGILFILVGGLFLINELVDINLAPYLWPLLFIFFGLVVIFSRVNREKPLHTNSDMNAFSLFSGTDVQSQSKNFQGGTVTTVFGGADIDLREVILSDEGATLDLTAVFGGISISVPENVHVEISGVPIFGGWEDKTRRYKDEPLSTLHLNCLTICGGERLKIKFKYST